MGVDFTYTQQEVDVLCKAYFEKGRAEALKEAFDKTYNKAYDSGYQQGRADKYQEITAEYMLLTEKQVAEIRADTLDEVISKVVDFHADMVLRYGMDIVEARADAFDELKEWLKEQMNG